VRDGADRIEDPWPAVDPGALAVMERIKARFDPARTFRPGAFVGGL
jgi:glycolate oxidase FAD binding subunit